MAWAEILAAPDGPDRVARGAGAGAFAAMLPAFGLHLAFALAAALLVRGSRPAAVAACLLLGNPLTHLAILPAAFELGRVLLPNPAPHGAGRLPGWIVSSLPLAEEVLLGGVLLGLLAGALALVAVRRAVASAAAARAGQGTGPCG